MIRTRFDVKLDEESFNAAKDFAKEWKLPITKATRRALIEYLHEHKYKKTTILIDFLGPIKDKEVSEGILLLSKEVDDEKLKKVIADSIKLYLNARRS